MTSAAAAIQSWLRWDTVGEARSTAAATFIGAASPRRGYLVYSS